MWRGLFQPALLMLFQLTSQTDNAMDSLKVSSPNQIWKPQTMYCSLSMYVVHTAIVDFAHQIKARSKHLLKPVGSCAVLSAISAMLEPQKVQMPPAIDKARPSVSQHKEVIRVVRGVAVGRVITVLLDRLR